MSEKKLVEFGISSSSNIIAEATKVNKETSDMARSFTYTTRDNGFPPTNLGCAVNPFTRDILNAKNILDFGCGVGRNLPWIAENTDAMYYGLDPNRVMIENFWKVTDRKYEKKAVLLASFEEIPEGMIFDVVVSTMVMQHLGYRAPDGAMDVTDMTQRIMEHTREGTIWFVYEHEREEHWIARWLDENNISPDVFELNYTGMPELLHRGSDSHLVIWREVK